MMTHPLESWLRENRVGKAAFAKETGVSRMAVWRVIQGRSGVSLAMLEKIEQATGISLTRLVAARSAENRYAPPERTAAE